MRIHKIFRQTVANGVAVFEWIMTFHSQNRFERGKSFSVNGHCSGSSKRSVLDYQVQIETLASRPPKPGPIRVNGRKLLSGNGVRRRPSQIGENW